VSWKSRSPTTKPGLHTLRFRYACSGTTVGGACRPLDLWVNNVRVGQLPFTATGAGVWTAYADNPAVTVTLDNSVGSTNTVELRAVNNVGPNIDRLTISSQ